MKDLAIGVLIILFVLGGGGAYIKYKAIKDERARVELQAYKDYQALNTKYLSISAKYVALKASKAIQRQDNAVKEDRIINENKDYYSAECFDAIGLQHIQESQRTAAPNTK